MAEQIVDKWLGQHTNTLDADVFTGPCLFEKVNRDYLKAMCERWLRAISTHEKCHND